MSFAHLAVDMPILGDAASWGPDWLWGIPLIVFTVVFHVLGLGVLGRRAEDLANRHFMHRHSTFSYVTVLGTTTLVATCLHAVEASMWAIAYRALGALTDQKSAMLYSLNAMTSYGHATLNLREQWALLGALEALNGWLLFGLTTAFLFKVIERVWLFDQRQQQRQSR